jgi:hypothetical protein
MTVGGSALGCLVTFNLDHMSDPLRIDAHSQAEHVTCHFERTGFTVKLSSSRSLVLMSTWSFY